MPLCYAVFLLLSGDEGLIRCTFAYFHVVGISFHCRNFLITEKKNALLSWLILKLCQSRGSANLASDIDIEIQKLDEPELEPDESEMRHRHRV